MNITGITDFFLIPLSSNAACLWLLQGHVHLLPHAGVHTAVFPDYEKCLKDQKVLHSQTFVDFELVMIEMFLWLVTIPEIMVGISAETGLSLQNKNEMRHVTRNKAAATSCNTFYSALTAVFNNHYFLPFQVTAVSVSPSINTLFCVILSHY